MHCAIGVIIKKEFMKELSKNCYDYKKGVDDESNKNFIDDACYKILKDYDEDLDVGDNCIDYTKEQLLEEAKDFIGYITKLSEEEIEKRYRYSNQVKAFVEARKELKKFDLQKENPSEEQLKEIVKKYTHRNEDFDKDFNMLTIYNPKSKWDWYEIGGRYKECLKNTKTGVVVNMGYMKDLTKSKKDYGKLLNEYYGYVDDKAWYESEDIYNNIEHSYEPYNYDLLRACRRAHEDYAEKYALSLNEDDIFVLVDCHI